MFDKEEYEGIFKDIITQYNQTQGLEKHLTLQYNIYNCTEWEGKRYKSYQHEFISIQNKEPGATRDVMAPEIARGVPLPVYMNF